jgi:hypothetical protein
MLAVQEHSAAKLMDLMNDEPGNPTCANDASSSCRFVLAFAALNDRGDRTALTPMAVAGMLAHQGKPVAA